MTKRTPIAIAVLASFVVSAIVGVNPLITAAPAAAQVVSAPGVEAVGALNASQATAQTPPTVNTSAQTTSQNVTVQKDSVLRQVEKAVVPVVLIAITNAVDYFAKKLAYDAATALATAGSGQKPLFVTDPGSYFKGAALDAAGEAIGTISQEGGFEKLGIDLCSPRLPKVALNIKLGFINDLKKIQGGPISSRQPAPKCDWKSIEGNWSKFSQTSTKDVLDQAGVMFSPGESGLDAALEFNRYSLGLMDKKQKESVDKFVANAGFKDLTTYISKQTKTPADSIRAHMNQTQQRAGDKTNQETSTYGQGIKEAGLAILGNVVKTFANTLIEKLSNRLFDGGLFTLGQLASSGDDHDFLLETEAGPEGQDRQAAELANKDLLIPRIQTVSNYDQLVEFSVCPSEGRTGSNCVMDTQFFTAVTRADEDAALTVRQAVDQGYLSGSGRLLPLAHPKNRSSTCYLDAYCYSNIAKMRRARILPIGWELAANSPLNDANNPVTLKEVMDRFNDCPVDSQGNIDVSKLPDPLHPWCHLIDPNWVLKYPKEICKLQAFGPYLVNAQTSGRSKVCVDSASCIFTDPDGTCTGGYGYCTREKSYWKFAAETCPAQFASCQAFKPKNGPVIGYLTNTTDVSVCGPDNAGCLRYSTIKNALPNGGFEDVFSGSAAPRGWALAGGAVVDRSGLRSFRGANAVGLGAGASLSGSAKVIPGSEYKFSASAIAQDPSASYDVEARLTFKDRAGAAIGVSNLVTSCVKAGGAATFRIPIIEFGHTTNGCSVTAPANAVAADIAISAISPPAGNVAWVDEVSLSGASYSADPLDAIFLNGKIQQCSPDKVGCTEVVRVSNAALNLVRNPSFESPDTAGTAPLFWNTPVGAYSGVGNAADGSADISLKFGTVSQDIRGALPLASYVFSVASRRDGNVGAAPTGEFAIEIHKADGSLDSVVDCNDSGPGTARTLLNDAGYGRQSCQFNTPSDIGFVKVSMRQTSGTDRILVDAAQLELAVSATPYHQGYGTSERLFIKKAPAGMTCTGLPTDPGECSNFAKSCRREDVGCNLYTPDGGGIRIPASVTSSDACPASCEGYDTFREEPTNFNDAKFPNFLIPKTASVCAASQAGCEEFTNIETLSQGGESREYFTYLRYCQKPDAQTGTYYTWEGNDKQGYQLRVWTLRRSNLAVAPTGDSGSDPTGAVASTGAAPSDAAAPCTVLGYDTNGLPVCQDAADAAAIATCSKSKMRINPDCREFYDVEGNIHYRLYSRTIVGSEDCKQFRMTRADQVQCESHGGFWTRNECHYTALVAESNRCNAAANGCRAYAGNGSRNTRVIFEDQFEDGTTADWAGPTPAPGSVINSNESVAAGGHSMKIAVASASKDVTGKVASGKQVMLTFWAKGSGDLDVSFTAGDGLPFSTLALTTDWKIYTAGPVTLGDVGTAVSLRFANASASDARPMFIDNVALSEVSQSIFLVRGTWKTPVECDQTPAGSVAPQYMLGCRAYKDRKNLKVHLKSFDRLCREEAAGCEAFYDTKNTESPFPETFNAVCTLPSTCAPTGGALTCGCQVAGKPVCEVVTGFKDCRYDTDDDAGNRLSSVDPVNGHISPEGDTVRINADSLVYLIDDKESYCDAPDRGCSSVGKRVLNPDGDVITSWETVTVKNTPDTYGQILCRKEEEFCSEYSKLEDRTPVYFKDPGNHACEFKTGVSVAAFTYNGWFKKGTSEPCYPDFLRGGNFYDIWRNSDSLYENWAGICPQNFSRCKEFVDPLDASNDFPYGRPYYAIANDRLDVKSCEGRVSRTTAPSGARDASACVLFRQADNVTLPYSAQPSYARSDLDFGALVPAIDANTIIHAASAPPTCPNTENPTSCCGNGFIEKAADDSWREECDRGLLNGQLGINCDAQCRALNDSNIVIRVKRDRQCAQWLDCRTSETVFNPADGSFSNVCTGYGLCGEYQKVGDTTRCVRFIDNDNSGKVLTAKEYELRDTSWNGLEYAGLSVPYRYPLEELKTIDTDSNRTQVALLRKPDPRLVYSAGPSGCSSYGASCGDANNVGNRGTCLGVAGALECVYPIDGSPAASQPGQLRQVQGLLSYPAASCRAYPQETAPFPSSVADPGGWDITASEINAGNPRFVSANPSFASANVCQRRLIGGVEVGTCECSYQIASYGASAKKYLSIADGDIPAGYCEGGVYEGFECDPLAVGLRTRSSLSCCSKIVPPEKGEAVIGGLSVDCEQGGECKPLSKVDHVIGYEGQCIERDFTQTINNRPDEFACMTWRPVGLVGGSRDIYNLYKSAGYFTPVDRRYYCYGSHDEWSMEITVDTARAVSDPRQPFLKFFRPGRVTNMELTFASGDNDCEDSDRDIGGEWCLFPGLSPRTEIFQKDSNGATVTCPDKTGCGGGFTCRCSDTNLNVDNCPSEDRVCKQAAGKNYQAAPAYSALGCYEVSDDVKSEKATIEWDYIGPPVYRDQLKYIYFVMVNQVSQSIRAVTNASQDTHGNCNDEHDDSMVTADTITGDAARLDSLNHNHILDEVGRWKKNMASRGGDVLFEAFFDSRNTLSRLKLTATDANDEGTFGIEKMGFRFKEGCQNVVRVDKPGQFGLTTALTDITNSFRNFDRSLTRAEFTDGTPMDHTSLVQACRPWGSIGGTTRNPTNGSPGETTNSPWGYVVKHPKQKSTDKVPNNVPSREAQVDQCTLNSFHAGSEYSSDRNDPKALQRLFRQVYDRFEFSTYGPANVDPGGSLTSSSYQKKEASAFDTTGDTSYMPEKISPPRVASIDLDKCDVGGCVARNLDKITVGNKDSGIITVPGGVYPATVRFFGWASHNAMPVVSRTVDWSDSFAGEPPAEGWYKNQKPICSADTSDHGAAGECDGSSGLTCRTDADCPGGAACRDIGNHFGNTPGACTTGTFQFEHTYTCTTRDLGRLTNDCAFDSRDRATNAPCRENFGTTDNPQWTCVYRPAAQIRDNWGWCNCTGATCRVPERGAYGSECERLASSGGTARPWTYFDGEIRVQAGKIDNLTFVPTGGSSCNAICLFIRLQRGFVTGLTF
jgi:hypothetical protein